ncbi:hypothetical protein BRC81_09870 [Halobacteriales archaeon QS_1_68_20]|nr:MAG: hypothetical protein BRC81_09870 [Halobacteriales archaeon QS_1_68_20]
MSPDRRRFLQRAGSGALLVACAGCNGRESVTPAETGRPATTARSTTTTEESAGQLEVDLDVTRYEYRLQGWELDPNRVRLPMSDATPVTDLDGPARDAVLTAIAEGRYETDDPPDAVLDGIEGLDLVVHDGQYYSISHTFTEYVVQPGAEVDPGSVPDDEVVAQDAEVVEEHPSVREAVETLTVSGTHSPRLEYRTLRLPAELESFLDRYGYLRDSQGIFRIRSSVIRQFPPHTLTVDPATDEQLYGRPVLDGSSFDDPSRRLLRETLETRRRTAMTVGEPDPFHRGVQRTDSVPLALERRVDRSAYVRLDGSVYGFRVDHVHWDRQPFDLSVRVADPGVDPDDPAATELTATNATSRSAELTVPGLVPFGVLWAIPDGEGESIQLWNDRFESSDHVAVEDGVAVPDSYQGDLTVHAGESVRRTYEFGRDPAAVTADEYTVWGSLWARWSTPGQGRYDRNAGIYPYELSLTVTR